MKAQARKHTLHGPGGMSCPCCAPQSGTKAGALCRKKMKRQALKRFYRANEREITKATQ